MCTLTAGVLGLSLRSTQSVQHVAVAAAPAGVVAPIAPSLSPTPLATRRPPVRPTRIKAKASPRPRVRASQLAVVTPTATHAASPAATSATVNGQATDTRYGPVQVQITVRRGHLVRVDAIDYPQGGGRDQEINSRAIPQLDQEALQAQSAQIDTVSGATYTSDGYRTSLQSALDAAHQAGLL